MLRQREEKINVWFEMWVGDDITPMAAIFADDVEYTKCWGYQYFGQEEIQAWFEDWHKNNVMEAFYAKDFLHMDDNKTVVRFKMEALTKSGTQRWIDGVYIVEWDEHDKIKSLEEYGEGCRKTRPYQK